MTDVPIIITKRAKCPQFGVDVLMTLCRTCRNHRYETVGGFVACDWVKPRDDKK